jgi:DNA-directed RNA polymerase, mitochondrial
MATQDTQDLMQLQISLEEGMSARGVKRFWKNLNDAKEAGREDETSYGQKIISGRMDVLSKAIGTWLSEANSGKGGRSSIAAGLLKGADTRKVSFLAMKAVMSCVSKTKTIQFVGMAIGSLIETEYRMQAVRDVEEAGYKRLLKEATKRGSTFHRRMYAIRASDAVAGFSAWSKTDRLHLGVKLLDIIMETIGLVEVTHVKLGLKKSANIVRALPETLEWIDKRNNFVQHLRPVYEPMVVQPMDWTSPLGGGYVSSCIEPLRLVKVKNSGYFEELKNADMPMVYNGVNALQRTPWQINTEVYEVMNHLWETSSDLGGIPPKDGLPLPPIPHDIDTNEDARKAFRRDTAKAHQLNVSLMGQRIGFQLAIDIASRYKGFRKIAFPYQLDFRGRVYAVPHLNPQGADYQKGLLRFANGKPLGSEGWKWLAMHGANLAGNDKVSLEDRVNWVLENESEICAIAADPYGEKGWANEVGGMKIDKPWQFLAFCKEWAGYVAQGESFISKLPVALDGSASGIQHFSAMLKSETGACVNLTPADKPSDVYGMVAAQCVEQANQDLVSGTEDSLMHNDLGVPYILEGTKTLAAQWLKFGITRKTCKRPVMTLSYGAKEFGFKDQVMEDILKPAYAAAGTGGGFPFQADGYRAAIYMAKVLWKSVATTLVAPVQAMEWLQGAASLVVQEGLPVSWTTPIGFPVQQSYMNMEARRVKTHLSGKLVYISMNDETDSLDKRRMKSAISPNFIHSCDAAHLLKTVSDARDQGITNFAMIHDSFGTLAADTEHLFRIVRESFVEIYTQVNVLDNFRIEIENQLSEESRHKLQPLPAFGSLDIQGVLESKYCFA